MVVCRSNSILVCFRQNTMFFKTFSNSNWSEKRVAKKWTYCVLCEEKKINWWRRLSIFNKLKISKNIFWKVLVRSISQEVFLRKGVLKNFAKFTGKHMRHISFLTCNFIKKETLAQVFSYEFCEIFKNTFLKRALLVVVSI